jgi:hypothetical protein
MPVFNYIFIWFIPTAWAQNPNSVQLLQNLPGITSGKVNSLSEYLAAICLVLAVVYFYFQPALLITPRRFLIVHMIITSLGITLMVVSQPRIWACLQMSMLHTLDSINQRKRN